MRTHTHHHQAHIFNFFFHLISLRLQIYLFFIYLQILNIIFVSDSFKKQTQHYEYKVIKTFSIFL